MENKQFYRILKNNGVTEVSEINYLNGVYSMASIIKAENIALMVKNNIEENFINHFVSISKETDKGVYYAFLSTYNECLLQFNNISQSTFDSLT